MKKYTITILAFSFSILFSGKVLAQDIASIINNAQKNPLFESIAPILSQLVFSSDSTFNASEEHPIDTTIISINGPLGPVKRTAKSNDFIAIETSESSRIEAKLLPLINDSKIVCVTKTACGNFCDSQIFFFTTNWEVLEAKDLFPTKNIEWFVNTTTIPQEELENIKPLLSDINPVKYTISPTKNTIIAESGLEQFLSDEAFKLLKPYFTKTKELTWNKNSFR